MPKIIFAIWILIGLGIPTSQAQTDNCSDISSKDVYSQRRIEVMYFDLKNPAPPAKDIYQMGFAQTDLINEANIRILKSELGKTLLRQSYRCDLDNLKLAMGLEFRDLTIDQQDSLKESITACRQGQSGIFPTDTGSLNCSELRTPFSRRYIWSHRPEVPMYSWTDGANRTYLNLSPEEFNLPLLGGRLYHELYIFHDSEFINYRYNHIKVIYQNKNQYRQLELIEPLKADENIKVISDPILQSTLSSMRALRAEFSERSKLKYLFGQDVITDPQWLGDMNTEEGCLNVLTQIFDILSPGACGIHRGNDADATNLAHSGAISNDKRKRSELITLGKNALESFKNLSKMGRQKNINLCMESTTPSAQLNCRPSGSGPSARSRGSR